MIRKRRVVVTGVGLVTPLGNSVAETWRCILEGKSGAASITKFDASRFPVRIAAEVKDFKPESMFEKDDLAKIGTASQYAVAAAEEALLDSGLRITPKNSSEAGSYIASSFTHFERLERECSVLRRFGPARISPDFIGAILPNLAAGNVAIRLGLRGPLSSAAGACAASNQAIGESFHLIQRGDADIMVCGGTDARITPLAMAGFAAMKALSSRNCDPTKASRPFDANRDGFVLGEGAGILVLEDLLHAEERGARIYAEIVGYWSCGDADHISRPMEKQSGIGRAMERAIRSANVLPDQVDCINAHGSSTRLGDRAEILALKKLFAGDAYKVAISSTKSMTGHLLCAAGGIEAVLCVLAIHDQILPPTINHDTPDQECDLDVVPNIARPKNLQYVVSNASGLGGIHASLVFNAFNSGTRA